MTKQLATWSVEQHLFASFFWTSVLGKITGFWLKNLVALVQSTLNKKVELSEAPSSFKKSKS